MTEEPVLRTHDRLGVEAKLKFYNTLTGLVKALEGRYTTIDLRNESYATGKITFVDAQMNVELEDVVFCDPRGTEHVFHNFYINKRNIRYVHIPKNISAIALIEKQITKMLPQKRNEKRSFKKARAKRYNEEVVQSAFKTDEETVKSAFKKN